MRLLSRAHMIGAVTAFASGLAMAGASTPASAHGYYYKKPYYGYYRYKPYYKPYYYNYYYKKRFHH